MEANDHQVMISKLTTICTVVKANMVVSFHLVEKYSEVDFHAAVLKVVSYAKVDNHFAL